MLNKLKMLKLKLKLKRYRQGEKYYLNLIGPENWYTSEGIPKLLEDIAKLK